MEAVSVVMTIAAFFVIAAVVRLRRRNMASGRSRAAAAAAVNDYRRTRDRADLGLACPGCEAVAEPMCDTHDRYCCVCCGLQFTAERHGWKSE